MNDTERRCSAHTLSQVYAGCVLALLLLGATATRAAGQHVRGHHHTTWIAGRELPTGGVSEIARSPDGYLWLGSNAGLIRFDGARFVVLDGTTVTELASAEVGGSVPLGVDAAGTLWIRRSDRTLVHYREGKFRVAVEADSALPRIDQLAQVGSGEVWLRGGGRVFAWRDGRLVTPALGGVPSNDITAVIADTGHGVWIGTRTNGLWHVTPNGAARFDHPDAADDPSIRPILQTKDGSLWVSGHRFQVLENGRWTQPDLEGLALRYAATIAADGSMWFTSPDGGLLQWRDRIVTSFTANDGLSNAVVHSVLSDDEGNLWITTDAGLDRLRTAAFTTIGGRAVPFESPLHIAGDAGGGVWAMDYNTLGTFLLERGRIDGHRGPIAVTPLPGRDVLLAASRQGGVWMYRLHSDSVYHVRNGVATPIRPTPDLAWKEPRFGFEDASGVLWLASSGGGFGRVRDFAYRAIPLPGMGDWPRVAAMTGDGRRTWIAMAGQPILFELDGDSVTRRFDETSGITAGLRNLTHERGDTLWATTSSASLVRLIGGRAAAVDIPEVRTAMIAGSVVLLVSATHLWVGSQSGIGRLPLTTLHAAADRRASPPAAQWFGELDGIAVARTTRNNVRAGFVAHDGRLWFSTPAGLAVADPDDIPTNHVAPRPLIEEVVVTDRDGVATARDIVTANPDRVEIHFTAASLRMPERVRIEHRLEGADRSWVRAANSRVATYTELRPGRYRFRVRAWNEDGVPSVEEASLAFRVSPAWYETAWFRALLVLAIAGAGAGFVFLALRDRQRREQERIHAGFAATLAERTRLANELHDTLLQGFTGITLQLQAVRQSLLSHAPAAAAALERALALADTTLRNARHTVWDMHAPELEQHDLAAALEIAARDAIGNNGISLRFRTRGVRRRLTPALETAAYRVGREAVLNAVEHGAPHTIDVKIDFDDQQLRLSVRDDGRGFDPSNVVAAASTGRLGMLGMRERAARAGGRLEIAATPGSGTVVSLILPTT